MEFRQNIDVINQTLKTKWLVFYIFVYKFIDLNKRSLDEL